LHGVQLGFRPPHVPVYLGALGPQMLRLAGEAADGAALNWFSPEARVEARERVAAGARKAGRDPDSVKLAEYIRVCVDEDVAAARRAYARATLGYALARPGASKDLAYRGHFARMGFGPILEALEAKRDAGASMDELADAAPDDLLLAVGYYGKPEGAGAAFRRVAEGLDIAVVRVVPARPGIESVRAVMQACRPS
ncbi:MAG TPA: LLM class flavin-dependent oxidoreductase, partial [Dehalococcoidia bacterium]|nr:LLM class flavin-dependent oxidoreductase [Dehalococcoidia bacterium]